MYSVYYPTARGFCTFSVNSQTSKQKSDNFNVRLYLIPHDKSRLSNLSLWSWNVDIKTERPEEDIGNVRHLLRIPWTAYRTNVLILQELKIKKRLLRPVQIRILVLWTRNEDSIKYLVVQSRMKGKVPRGYSPTRWSDFIKSVTTLAWLNILAMLLIELIEEASQESPINQNLHNHDHYDKSIQLKREENVLLRKKRVKRCTRISHQDHIRVTDHSHIQAWKRTRSNGKLAVGMRFAFSHSLPRDKWESN